jgi:hypothetical protein
VVYSMQEIIIDRQLARTLQAAAVALGKYFPETQAFVAPSSHYGPAVWAQGDVEDSQSVPCEGLEVF